MPFRSLATGDIFTADQSVRKQQSAHTDGVMIGRGAMGNPWIFRDIRTLQSGGTPVKVSNAEKLNLVIRHYQMMLETRPEPIAVREMRKHIIWYIKGMRGASQFRAEINRCTEASAAIDLIRLFFHQNETDQKYEETEG